MLTKTGSFLLIYIVYFLNAFPPYGLLKCLQSAACSIKLNNKKNMLPYRKAFIQKMFHVPNCSIDMTFARDQYFIKSYSIKLFLKFYLSN